ncbi:MAG: hypothetical protein IJV33_05885 [Bacteroidaceae bacterium]|nr:hypothetical protein [Bacteroidaceae bacterium]
MRITGTLTKVGDLKQGVAQESGNVWCNRDITITWSEETKYSDGRVKTHEQALLMTLKGDNARNFSLEVGTRVETLVGFSVNHYKERDYQNVYCSSIYVAR